MRNRTEEIKASVIRSIRTAGQEEEPYRHWLLRDVFPADVYAELKEITFPLVELGGVSGTREVHNADRHYFDADNQQRFPVVRDVAAAFQDPEVIAAMHDVFGGRLGDTYLRIEYAQDIDGFWLKPHTDIGVKMFTMLIYLSDDASHRDLGTDIYADEKTHVGRSPFDPNSAMIFVPSDRTWHGFEARTIEGVRKSMIVNYVTNDWRAREQLSFQQPIAS
jgi:hypothetical protein